MDEEMIALIGLGVTVLANVAALAWGASRVSATVSRLDRTLDKLNDTVVQEGRLNAVQDQRLDEHGRRLDSHDKEIDQLWRKP